jgi:UPF0716 family protein affecting phage T7 exclusion
MPKTVVGLIDGENHVQDAIDELLKAGFDRKDISLVAPDVRSESERVLSTTRTGMALGGTAAMLLAGAALVIPGIGSTLVAGPLLAIPALATLAGGLVGALMASGVSEADAHFYAEGVRRGGALVAVRAQNDEQAARAAEILKRNCAVQQNQRAEV